MDRLHPIHDAVLIETAKGYRIRIRDSKGVIRYREQVIRDIKNRQQALYWRHNIQITRVRRQKGSLGKPIDALTDDIVEGIKEQVQQYESDNKVLQLLKQLAK